jgi:Domain of unknown function DUF11
MNASDHDELLTSSFAEYVATVAPSVHPAGPQAVRATVAYRRRARTVALGVVAALAVVVPVTAYAAFGRSAAPAPGSSPSPSVSAVEPSPSGSAEPTEPPGPSGPCDQPSGVPSPVNAISLQEFCNASLHLPAWPRTDCAPTDVPFRDGRYHIGDSLGMYIGTVVPADIDRDGRPETVAIVACGGELLDEQVVAFGRAADGSIQTVGRVVITNDPVRTITALVALPDGTLQVTVGDFGDGVGDDQSIAQHQQRSYRWIGQKFVQVGGPTAFPPNPRLADLVATSPDLVFGAPSGGKRTATFTITAKNLGPGAVPALAFVQLPAWVRLVSGPAPCHMQDYPSGAHQVECQLASLAAGSTTPLTFHFEAPANADTLTSEFVPTVGIQIPYEIPTGLADPNLANNGKDLTIRYQ